MFKTITYLGIQIDPMPIFTDKGKVERTGVFSVHDENLTGLNYCFSRMQRGRDFEIQKMYQDNYKSDIHIETNDFHMILDASDIYMRPDIFSPFNVKAYKESNTD
jgi:hypothetical protein